MKKLLLLMMTLLPALTAWGAEHVVINTNNSTNTSDWTFTKRGDTYNQGSGILTWGFPNSITVTGSINQDGLDFLYTESHKNNQNGNCPLDLSGATLAADVTTFPNMYTKVMLPTGTDPSGFTFGGNLQYAISQGDPTYIYAASGTSLSSITELGTISGQKFVVCGPGQEALEEAIKNAGGIVGGLEVEAGNVAGALAGATPSEVTALIVVEGEGDGTLTASDISFITGTLTSLESLDISETTVATAEDLWTLLNNTSATSVTLGTDNIALLKTLSGKTFTPALLAKIGITAADLMSGMTTTNYIIDGSTLIATGTLSDNNVTEMTAMTGINTIDISNASATAAQIADLLDGAPARGVNLGSDNIATLQSGSGQTIDISKIADSGVTAATLASGMTTTNYIIDGSTLIVTGNIDSTADSDMADIINANNAITSIDASRATNTTAYEIADKGSQITLVSLPTSGNVTYGGAAITLVDGVLEITIDANDTDANYTSAAAMLSALGTVLDNVEHLKISGTLTTQDIDDLFTNAGGIGGHTNITTLDLSEAAVPQAADWASVAEASDNATAVLLPAGTDLSTGWDDWGTNFYAVDGTNDSQLNVVVNNAAALPAGNYFAGQEEANTLKAYDGNEKAGAGTATTAYLDYDVATIDLTSADKQHGPENDEPLNTLKASKTVLEPIEIGPDGKVKINGNVNPAIIASLNALSCNGNNFNAIDLSEATLVDADGNPDKSIIDELDNSCLEYLYLPAACEIADMETLKDNNRNPNLIAAGSYQDSDVKNLNVWLYTKGNMQNFINRFALANKTNGNSGLQKLTLGGYIAQSDIMNGNNKRIASTSLKEMDLTYSSFESCNINTGNCYSISKGYVSSAPSDIGNGIASNALFYLRNYGLETVALPDPNNSVGGNTEIPPHTFTTTDNYGTIANITIPEGYTKIGTEAFYGHQLTELDLPSTIEEIGVGAFASITNTSSKCLLTDVTMHAHTGVQCVIGAGAFARNINLKHVTLSEGVMDISNYMFHQCYQLESIRIPSTCATIGTNAFYECVSMHVVTIPDGVEIIYTDAFELSGLTELYIMASSPERVPKIYSIPFNKIGGGTNGLSTFSGQRMAGYGTPPNRAMHPTSDYKNYGYDEIVNWYQAELSDPKKGLGTGNSYVALHYPDNMKPFYEGINPKSYYEQQYHDGKITYEAYQAIMAIPGMADATGSDGWISGAPTNHNGLNIQTLSTNKTNGKEFLPEAYAERAGFYDLFGPDKDGKYYPTQADLFMRVAAGLGDPTVLSQWGWRQFPLAAAVGDIGKKIYDREYDYTWYTMCFPWHLTDEQLFMAFQPNCEIVEFVGAEVILQSETRREKNYALVLHFDDVAQTYYIDGDDKIYNRELIGTRVFQTTAGTSTRNVYRYTEVNNPSNVITYPLEYTTTGGQTVNQGITVENGGVSGNMSNDQKERILEEYANYLTIQNILAVAGHPYMIHPAVGAVGVPATVHFTGIEIKDGISAEEVTRLATTGAQNYNSETYAGATEPANTGGAEEYDGESAYTFVGYLGGEDPENAGHFLDPSSTDDEYTTMPALSYFLAVRKSDDATASANDKIFPKYYRKKADAPNTWRKYTAIIKPNDAAIANIEDYMDMTSASANGFDVAFGEWEIVTPTAIEQIVEEAEKHNQPVQKVYLNVVYNVKGQVVRTGNTSLEGLPKGLYIVNGKKYMVK